MVCQMMASIACVMSSLHSEDKLEFNMSVFGDYARYYNLLYKDKDYGQETDFVLGQLKACGCKPQTLLDIGCGTGRHAFEVARRGIAVTGVDMSQTMLAMGRDELERACGATVPYLPLPCLLLGDARTVRLGKTFDAVTSLFHVMSYQITEEDALSELETARQHLQPGGIFLFDFWYGPGVLADPPEEREKIMEDSDIFIRRHARPVHRINDNIVDVHYSIELTEKHTGVQKKLHEVHSMRYWFLPELRYLANIAGFVVVANGPWLQREGLGERTWNAWMALKNKN